MSELIERIVRVNGFTCRVWEKGNGPKLGYLAGIGGLPRWTPFLDLLAQQRCVVVPSLPGFPGATGHTVLDDQLDWILATGDLLREAGLSGADLIGASLGGALAADVAAVWNEMVSRLVLIAPFGWFDEKIPVADIWAQRPGPNGLPALLCEKPERFVATIARPDEETDLEWDIMLARADEAAARCFYPFGDTGLSKRLRRITQPTLLVHGARDRVVPIHYAEFFATEISGETQIHHIADAGHLADLDEPELVAEAVLNFLT